MNKKLRKAIEGALKTGHSLFSPSSAWKYMLCPGSTFMERDYEDSSSDAANLGSDKHELSEICLNKGTRASNYEGRLMTYGNEVDDKFIEEVQYYVDFVQRVAAGAEFAAYEMRVDLSDVKGLPDEGGTSDTVVLKGNHLFIIDAKFGYIKVPAEGNFQLLEYGIGVYNELDSLGLTDDIEKVSLIIVMPQHDIIDDWVIDVEYLHAHSAKVTTAIEQACQPFAGGELVLNPGPKQCKWCRAFADCDAARDVVFEAVNNHAINADAFDDLSTDDLKAGVELGTKRAGSFHAEKLSKCYALVDYIHDWCKAIKERVYEKLDHGEAVPGYKLVAGRKGNKTFIDAEEAEATLRGARVKVDDIFTKKLISPTQAEKLLKTDKPKVWAKLQPMIKQADGKPVIALESDRKPAIKTTADEFDDLEELA